MGSYTRERVHHHEADQSRRRNEDRDDRSRPSRYAHHDVRDRRHDRDFRHRERADVAVRQTRGRSPQEAQRAGIVHAREQDPEEQTHQTAQICQAADHLKQRSKYQEPSNAASHRAPNRQSFRQHEHRYRDRSAERDQLPNRSDARQGWTVQQDARPYRQNPSAQMHAQAAPQDPQTWAYQQQRAHDNHGQSPQQAQIPAHRQDKVVWPSQRGDIPIRRGPNPFKGRGKWGHDLFEELVKTSDAPPQTAVVKASQAAVDTAAN